MPTTDFYNPFQSLQIRLPKSVRTDVARVVQTKAEDGKQPSPSRAPFPRVVDFWFLSVCLGARHGHNREARSEESYEIVDGSILSTDRGRVELLTLLAIGETGNPELVQDQKTAMQVLNSLAASGAPVVLEYLERGKSEPIWNLTESLLSDFEEQGAAEKES